MNESSADFTVCRYRSTDEGPHGGKDVENYNESWYFNFMDPRSRVGGIMRVANRPTLGYREFSINIKLPNGAIAFRAAREPHAENDLPTAGGLSFTVVQGTRQWTLGFRGTLSIVSMPATLASNPGRVLKSSPLEQFELELQWNAGSPVYVLTPDGSGKPTPGETSLMGTDHYEQFGTVSGRVRLGSQCWVLDQVPSMRDHTWGPRIWGSYVGEWMCAFMPEGTGMSLYSELQASGKRVYSGTVMYGGKPHYVQQWTVLTAYDGGMAHEDRHRSVLRADGLPVIPLDGVISHFSPLTMATGEHRTRLTSMVVEYVDGSGGVAFAEFLRPL